MDDIIKQEEQKYLAYIVKTAQEQLVKSKERSIRKQEEILEAKREQRENTASGLGNLFSADGFEELVELNQYANQISLQVDDFEREERKIQNLYKIIKVPYFARVDFKFQGEEEAEPIYIGRLVLTGDKDYDIKVYDWRSPIASVFYQYGIGEAQYQSPSGIIQGDISVKRQYEIKESQLVYYFDSEMEIMDEFLKKLLAQNASQSMHAIVETIQKDQDVVIRDLKSDLMIVQGVAGSGKTSVALHRAAFLMYQGLEGKLLWNHIVIISPNTLFEQYISRVLPELGEENVVSYVFEDIIEKLLTIKKFQSYRAFLELSAEQGETNSFMHQSFTYKTAPAFIECMKKFVPKHSHIRGGRALFYALLEEKECASKLFDASKEAVNTKKMLYEDALCMCFLQLLQTGSADEHRMMKQVIIDEVQDYTALHFEILKIMYPQASYTILGDINQSISRKVTLDYYDQIRTILAKPKSVFVNMNKSFRCSKQILEFSAQFLDNPASVESFCRDGDMPEYKMFDTQEELEEDILLEVQIGLQKGYDSIAVICENQRSADELQKRLSKQMDISLVRDNSESPMGKVFAIPLYMAKGLEFDGVVGVNITNRQHLYIASTRALHRLKIVGINHD